MHIVADENIPLLNAFFPSFGDIRRLPGREISPRTLDNADVLLIRSVTPVHRALLQDSAVRFIGTCTIGTDHMDLAYLQQRGVAWANAPGCNARSVVDYVLGCLLYMADRTGCGLSERVYGIVGAGQVGHRLAHVMNKLGWQVKICDPPRKRHENRTDFVSLAEIVRCCDVISLHTPLTREGDDATYHLLNEENLAALKPGTWLINSSRGAVIDNSALYDRLCVRDDLQVALDVWENEPGIDRRLAQKCLLATPHIAGYSLDGKWRGTAWIYQAFCRWLQVEPQIVLENLLPSAWLASLQLSADAETQWAIRTLCRAVYDPRQDDSAFRLTLSGDENQRRQAFDQLRKYYPYRREIPELTVIIPSRATHLQVLAEALGVRTTIIP